MVLIDARCGCSWAGVGLGWKESRRTQRSGKSTERKGMKRRLGPIDLARFQRGNLEAAGSERPNRCEAISTQILACPPHWCPRYFITAT